MKHVPHSLHVLVAAMHAPDQGPTVPYTHLEALYAAMETQGDQVKEEWLWPATMEQLAARLQNEKQPGVHMVFLASPGGPFPPELRNVPLIVAMDAQEGSPSADLQAFVDALAEGSGPAVVALDGGLSAQGLLAGMTALLTSLAGGHAIDHAVQEAQRSLRGAADQHPRPWADADASPSPEAAIRLVRAGAPEPLIPAKTGAASGKGKVVRFSDSNLTPAWQQLASQPEPGGLPPEPKPGFCGRAGELAALEGALRGDQGIVLVQGESGLGKTTLAAHAARWLVRTGRFRQVVYTNFLGGGNAEQALYDLGKRLLGREWSLREKDAVERVVQALHDTPTLVVWDDLQAVLPKGEFALEAKELDRLLQLGARLAHTGQSRLCVISENAEIPGDAYDKELALRLPVERLPEQDALDLLQALLSTADTPMPRREDALTLVAGLGGHPLALGLLAPLLHARPLADLLAHLDDLLPGFRSGAAHLSHKALDVALQALLLSFDQQRRSQVEALGMFVGGFMSPMLSNIQSVEKTDWENLYRQLEPTGAVREAQVSSLTVPYVAITPALVQMLVQRLEEARRKDWAYKLYNSYLTLMVWAMQREAQAAEPMRYLARLELPNIRRGLAFLLDNGWMDTGLEYAKLLEHHLRHLGFYSEVDALGARTRAATVKALSSEQPLERGAVRFLFTITEQLAVSGRLPEALALLTKLRERWQTDNKEQKGGLSYKGYDAVVDLASTLRRLGGYKLTMGQEAPAIEHYTEAIKALRSLVPNDSLRQELVELYNNLGEAQLAALDLSKAEEAYQEGLKLAVELKNERAVGLMYTRLGTVATVRNDNAQARQLLEEALAHLAIVEDYISMATTWSQLATLALRLSDTAEAVRCYENALQVAEKAKQPGIQAQLCVRLARLAEQAGQNDEARARYEQAIHFYAEQNIPLALASTQMDLASLLLREGKAKQAKVHAEKARPIIEKVGAEAKPWEVHSLLERIAKVEGDAEKEALWHARAQESFAESPEAKKTLEHWQGIIDRIAGACRGEALDNKLVELLESLESTPQWRELVEAVWRVLGGERGAELYAELEPMPALLVREILRAIESPAEAASGE
jgi:tetratricopeptide (TPR) repeat protein